MDQDRKRNVWVGVGMVIAALVLLASIVIIVWVMHSQNPPGTVCMGTNQCPADQNCNDGFCINTTCSLNSDCGPSQECVNGTCFSFTCVTGGNCEKGTVCQNGICTPIGATCTSGINCNNNALICASGFCVQCQTTEDCETGVCGSDGQCHATCTNVTGACPGQTCIHDFCCTGARSDYPGSCSDADPCPSNQFCVNGACTCSRGPVGAQCISGNDCTSGNCTGGICIVSGGNCFYNFDPNLRNPSGAYCGSGTPYCSGGTCSSQSEGAPCSCFSSTTTSTGTCTQFSACNIILATGATGANATTTYCVNNICQINPGWVNASCTSSFDCAAISGNPKCSNGVCV